MALRVISLPRGNLRVFRAKQFIGQYSDPETNLNYLQARYYDGSKGEFLSEDPVFWGKQNIPDPQWPTSWRTAGNASNSAYANPQQKGGPTSGWSDAYLRDPQAQNSYSYSRDNPMRYSDPDGLWYKELLTGQQSWSSFQGELNGAAAQLGADSPTWNYAFGHPVVSRCRSRNRKRARCV